MSTFDFSTLYTKIPHDKLLCVLNKMTDFAFTGGTRDYVTVYSSVAFWSRSKSKASTVNQVIPHRQKKKYWYLIRVLLKCSWDIGQFEIHQRVLPLPNQANLFLILRVNGRLVSLFLYK